MKSRPECPEAAASMKGAESARPSLPAWKAFVVQFSRQTRGEADVFSGRVEHLSSGRRAHFASREELLAILDEELRHLEEAD